MLNSQKSYTTSCSLGFLITPTWRFTTTVLMHVRNAALLARWKQAVRDAQKQWNTDVIVARLAALGAKVAWLSLWLDLIMSNALLVLATWFRDRLACLERDQNSLPHAPNAPEY